MYCVGNASGQWHGLPVYHVLWFQVVLPPHLERIREKLAENIHELWVMNKIDLGWTYGAVSTHVHAHTSRHGHTCTLMMRGSAVCSPAPPEMANNPSTTV